ncbi:hypothetical protein SAMN05428988_3806 [Chitinophaga sp. YR573]|nr:hypothetical protein SAMN05428988_3806 [Chitinophaga sp. YR573]
MIFTLQLLHLNRKMLSLLRKEIYNDQATGAKKALKKR